MHDGRPIRVQLRDRNPPPRTPWRPGRGRGRMFLNVSPGGRSAFGVGNLGQDMPNGPPLRQGGSEIAISDELSVNAPNMLSRQGTDVSTPSMSSSTTKVPSEHCEVSQGPASTTASLTPPPSNLPAAVPNPTTAPLVPYNMNMGYFPHQPWLQPYPMPYTYPLPTTPSYGYAGYPYHAIQPLRPQNPTKEQSTASSTVDHSSKVRPTPSHLLSTAHVCILLGYGFYHPLAVDHTTTASRDRVHTE